MSAAVPYVIESGILIMPSLPPRLSLHFIFAGATIALVSGCGNENAEVRESAVTLVSPIVLSTELAPVITDDTREVIARISVRNPTSDPLRIISISSSCGCLSAELGSSHLGPLRETTLTLRIGVNGKVGRRTVHGRLRTDRELEFQYQVSFTALQRTETEHYHWSFGKLNTTERVVRDILIRTNALAGDEPPRILDVNTGHSGLQCSIETDRLLSSRRGVSTREVTLRLSLTPETAVGAGSAYVQLKYEYGGNELVKSLPVFWRVDSLYHVTPARLVCVSTEPDQLFEREILLKRRDGQPFRIRCVQSDSDRVSIRIGSCSMDLAWTVNVTIDGTSLTSRVLFAEVSINTDVEDEPSITIPIILTQAKERIVGVRVPNNTRTAKS